MARRRRETRLGAAVAAVIGLAILAPVAATADDLVVATIPNASGITVPTGVAISPDGSRAYVLGPAVGTVTIIDTATRTTVGTISRPNLNAALAVSPDGTRLYVTDTVADAVLVFDLTADPPAFVRSIPVGDLPIAVVFTPDGSRAYVPSTNGQSGDTTVSVIDTATETVVHTLAGTLGSRNATISPDGSRVYVANATALVSSVSIIDTTTDPPSFAGSIPLGGNAAQLRSMVVSADGKLYGTRSGSDALVIIDLDNGNQISTVPAGESPTGIAITPDGTRLYVTNTDSANATDTVSMIATASIGDPNPPLPQIQVGNDPRGIAITPDGRFAFVADTASQAVSVIALDTFPEIVTTTVPDATVGGAYSAHLDVTGVPTPAFAPDPVAGALPPGLMVSPAGDLTGTPTAAGTYTFTLIVHSTVSGAIAASDTQEYTIDVAPVTAGPPLVLTAQPTGDAVGLTWSAPAFDGGAPITGYRIERSVDGGGFVVLVADTGTTDTSYLDGDVATGATYAYRVQALNAAGPGQVSNDAAAVLPPVETTTTPSTSPEPPTTAPPTTAPAPPPPTSPAPTMPVPVLPETGAHPSSQLTLAVGAMLLGLLLLLGVRRRRTG